MLRKFGVLRFAAGILIAALFLLPGLLCASGGEDVVDLLGPHPLEPPNTSSPRDTLHSFEVNLRESIRRIRERLPPNATDQAIIRVLSTLDLSRLPPAKRDDQGFYAAVLLAEVLIRVELPPQEEIPGQAEVANGELDEWTIPRTDITIGRIAEGPYAGDWQFTADTIARVPEFFNLVQELPVRPGYSSGFYEEWSHAPGPWLPREWTEGLPGFAHEVILGQTIWQWFSAVVTLILTGLLIFLAYRLGRKADNVYRSVGQRGHLGRILATLVAATLPMLATGILDNAVNITGRRLFFLNGSLLVVQAGAVAWLAIVLLNATGEWIVRMRAPRSNSVDASLVRIIVRLLGFVAMVYLAIFIADLFGIPATPLIASLGVGGLAIALAVRPTLENVIGGFILFADRPVCVGDVCRYGGQIGTVEEIGLRSTRVRSLERTTVTIPNAEFSQLQLENFSKRDMRLFSPTLTLRYETTLEQMRFILARLRQLLLGHPKVTPEPARVRFVEFADYSKNVDVFAYIDCVDNNEFLAIQEDILLRIEDIIAESGSGFAFPSQTAYLTQDPGMDKEKTEAAEKKVGGWRRKGQFPFPDFDDDERERYEDVLDYPPKGSPHYQSRSEIGSATGSIVDSVTLQAADLNDLPGMVTQINGGDAVAKFVRERLASPTEALLANWNGGSDPELRAAIVTDLNAIIDGPLIYDEQRFANIEIDPRTLELLDSNPEGEDLRRLNRLLLNQVYPKSLAR